MKTVKEHLKKLPLQKRLQAMENIRREGFLFMIILNHKIGSKNLISGLFMLDNTRQGHEYWWEINDKYYGDK